MQVNVAIHGWYGITTSISISFLGYEVLQKNTVTFKGSPPSPPGTLWSTNIAGWDIPSFNRKIIFKGSISYCYVSLPECNTLWIWYPRSLIWYQLQSQTLRILHASARTSLPFTSSKWCSKRCFLHIRFNLEKKGPKPNHQFFNVVYIPNFSRLCIFSHIAITNSFSPLPSCYHLSSLHKVVRFNIRI